MATCLVCFHESVAGWIVFDNLLSRLAYQATGVIYGDIGTSPLYVYSSTFSSAPSHDDLVGVLSIIIWTLTLMVSVKYMIIVLRADDEGEGGTFALFTLLSRYVSSLSLSQGPTRWRTGPDGACRSILSIEILVKRPW